MLFTELIIVLNRKEVDSHDNEIHETYWHQLFVVVTFHHKI